MGCGGGDSEKLFQQNGGSGGSSGSSGHAGQGSLFGGSGGVAGDEGAAGDEGPGGSDDPFGGAGTSSSGTGGTTTGGKGGTSAGGKGGASVGGAAGSTSPGGGQGGTTVEPTGPVRRARVATLTELSVWQAVKVTLVSGGVPVKEPNAPVVAGRAALVRAYVSPGPGFTARTLRAELRVDDGIGNVAVLSDEHLVSGASTDATLASSFAFELTAAQVTPETRLSVTLIDDTEPPDDAHEVTSAELPAGGTPLAVGAQAQGAPVRITLVPLRYDTDGSHRLPDTSPAQLARYESTLRAVYPITDVTLTVHSVVPWSKSLYFGDVNFSAINAMLLDLKADDNAPSEEYYYALISPDEDLDAYLAHASVTGQSYVVEEADYGDYRVGGGMGFGTEDSTWTLAHELGHLHGRSHSPCGTSSYDKSFPYKSGNIGVWGYDQRTKKLLGSTKSYDLMSYCDPLWISDFTYAAIFERVQQVSALSGGSSLVGPLTSWATLLEHEDGSFEQGPVVRQRGGHEGRVPLSHGGAVWFAPAP